MSSKRGLKDKLGMAIYDNPRLNEKLLIMKKSFDEVNKGLQGGRKKEDKKEGTAIWQVCALAAQTERK